MKKRYPKRVNPETMITHFEEICKSVGLKGCVKFLAAVILYEC